jgi:hypothetical protein
MAVKNQRVRHDIRIRKKDSLYDFRLVFQLVDKLIDTFNYNSCRPDELSIINDI